MKKLLSLCGLLLIVACGWNFGATDRSTPREAPKQPAAAVREVVRDGEYTSKDDVARYIRQFGTLPRNFITKSQARALGIFTRFIFGFPSAWPFCYTDKTFFAGDPPSGLSWLTACVVPWPSASLI